MKAYFFRKILALPLILLGVSFIVFMAVRALPGDPARLMAGPDAPEAALVLVRERLGLNQPVIVQYGYFLVNALQGDLGMSLRSKVPVTQEIADRFPNTLKLAFVSYMIAVLVGIPAGILSAAARGRWPDQLVMIFAILAASLANFWLALMGMNLFAVKLGWLPLMGMGTWQHYILPSVTLALLPAAIIARMTRSSMIEVLGQDYIRTARAKGIDEGKVYRKHALRNALIPIVTIVGLNFGAVVSGAVVAETVFSWPGIGRLLVDAVRYRDYPVIQGVTLLTVASVVIVNLAADLLIMLINPRVRVS
ncbi:ABC transporter permease [Pelagovum pacificum]|uniref:ABC transporter permease n=1 Tax=Pelagovum pacificum TaxID=2588711 RepID=A0A5C5GD79_9RHOB|nr:ABC transporter permease [Pelagovum pacificum]QQA44250.1 ABC transporter permease [Pelagovum pacificum]TNY32628.1 ABC transporter permease [Pelagovum pacificum]